VWILALRDPTANVAHDVSTRSALCVVPRGIIAVGQCRRGCTLHDFAPILEGHGHEWLGWQIEILALLLRMRRIVKRIWLSLRSIEREVENSGVGVVVIDR
jgi:hypothetical protein